MRLMTRTIQNRFDAFFVDSGFPESLIMEHAGIALREFLCRSFPTRPPLALFAGSGNNGGDVLVLARLLAAEAWNFTLYTEKPLPLSSDAVSSSETVALQHALLRASGISSQPFSDYQAAGGRILVDGVLGSGFRGERGLTEEHRSLFQRMNIARSLGSVIVSVDLPSGLDAETGNLAKGAVRADYTIALDAPQFAVLNDPGKFHAGRILCKTLALPKNLVNTFYEREDAAAQTAVYGMDEALFRSLDEIPSEASHKGSMGRVILFAGSDRYPGAALLAAGAALRSGAGYVELVSSPGVLRAALQRYPELIVHERSSFAYDEQRLDEIRTAVVLGPGMADYEETFFCYRRLLTKAAKLILDAGVFDVLSRLPEDTRFSTRPAVFPEPILTPHPGEFRRIFDAARPVAPPEPGRREAVRNAALRAPCTIHLKGSSALSYSAQGNRLYLNCSGNRGLAVAGSGDVLAGIMGAVFAASERDPVEVAAMAAFLHGRAADRLAKGAGPDGVTPSGLLTALGPTLRSLRAPARRCAKRFRSPVDHACGPADPSTAGSAYMGSEAERIAAQRTTDKMIGDESSEVFL